VEDIEEANSDIQTEEVSETQEYENTEEDRRLNEKLCTIFEQCKMSPAERDSVREWYRFSYLFDIGKQSKQYSVYGVV
jgi:hypothetical protein